MELRPDLLAGLPDHPPEAAPRVAQRHHEQTGTAVPAAPGINRHSAPAIVDLGLLAGEELKLIKLLGIAVSQRAHKPLDALVAGRKAKLIDQILVDRLRIPLQADLFFDPSIHVRCGSQAERARLLVTVAPDAPEAGGRSGGIWPSTLTGPVVTSPGEFTSVPARSAP